MRIWHVSDVMTSDVVTVGPAASYREVVALLAAYRINALPVVDADRRILGVVSESDLLRKVEYAGADRLQWYEIRGRAARRKAGARTAGELMTAPAEVVLATTGIRAAARRMDEANVKQLPVEDLLGRLVGMVSRSDLLKEHLRHDDDILIDVRAAVQEATLTERDSRVGAVVEHGQVTLTGRVERWSTAVLAERLVRLVAGVVFVDSRVTFDVDDHDLPDPAPAYFVS